VTYERYLEIIPNEQLIWTNALQPGYRPSPQKSTQDSDAFSFTAILSLESQENGTKYRAVVIHGDEAACKKHHRHGVSGRLGQSFKPTCGPHTENLGE
jgi:hypothetical protein